MSQSSTIIKHIYYPNIDTRISRSDKLFYADSKLYMHNQHPDDILQCRYSAGLDLICLKCKCHIGYFNFVNPCDCSTMYPIYKSLKIQWCAFRCLNKQSRFIFNKQPIILTQSIGHLNSKLTNWNDDDFVNISIKNIIIFSLAVANNDFNSDIIK